MEQIKFLEKLQQEYIISELRFNIYPSPNDKRYYEKVMSGKKEKILNISNKKGLSDIFSDNLLKESIIRSIMPEWGLPEFYYNNEKHRDSQRNLDIENYYNNSDVQFYNDNGKIISGKVLSVDCSLGNVVVMSGNIKYIVDFDNVKNNLKFL